MRQVFFLIATIFAVAGRADAGPISAAYNYNGHDYYLLSQASWTASEADAVSLGGHLATINDDAENDWVYSAFSSVSGGFANLWIGLNDAATEGTFVWSSGEAVTYTNWGGAEPNNRGDEDYVQFFLFYGNGWNDAINAGNGQQVYGIAEIAPAASTVPEPASLALMGLGGIGMFGGWYRKRRKMLAMAA